MIRALDAMSCCTQFDKGCLKLHGFRLSPVKYLGRFNATVETNGIRGEGIKRMLCSILSYLLATIICLHVSSPLREKVTKLQT